MAQYIDTYTHHYVPHWVKDFRYLPEIHEMLHNIMKQITN